MFQTLKNTDLLYDYKLKINTCNYTCLKYFLRAGITCKVLS